MTLAQKIEHAIRQTNGQQSFIQGLLVDALGWPVNENATSVEDISYQWSKSELQAQGLNENVVAGTAHQIVLPDNPWGIFVLEFKNPNVFATGRGMTGTLRRVLRGLVPKKRAIKNPSLRSFDRENLLFICTCNYQQFRFAYFKAPHGQTKTAPLAAFGWSPDEPARTACEVNLPELSWPDRPISPADWVTRWAGAFDVEKVTKRFYADYAARFEELRGGIKDIRGEEQKMFTQTLLNRLMFLRFIERKGWLTAPGGETSRDYLRLLYAAGKYRGKSFYTGRLKKLFFEGLAIEGKQESEAIGKVPFLNGGLFEQNELDDKVDDIDDDAFESLLGSEGLFYRYNFTVQESTPLDIEVAVDPEMLGKVFEELVTGRHESGSYYTPRPVVSFMCREALKGYLANATKIADDKVAAFVDKHETPFGIEDARNLAKALDDLRATDPACGSGAYLLGLLHEMVDLFQVLYSDKLKKDDRELHKIKLNIIEKSLYGVDVDPFATNIAMLRLWLSLSVDSDKPQALPNLDFKIEAGDSLTGPNPQEFSALHLHEPARQLAILKGKYMRARGEEKKSLRRLIDKEQKAIAFELRSMYPGAIDWRVQFCEVFFSDRGGFDIVLANPPYIRQELIKDLKPALKKTYKDSFSGTADLYVFFYLRALQLLAQGGMLVFISSNKWFRANYGEKLRSLIAKQMTVKLILDFHDLPVFESAIAYPMIFVAAKQSLSDKPAPILAEPPTLDPPYPDVAAVVAKSGIQLPMGALGSNGEWQLASAEVVKRLAAMRASGSTLGGLVEGRFFRGLLTGLNEAWIDRSGKIYIKGDKRPPDAEKHGVFVLDGAERECLIAEDKKSDEVIKPLITGRDINRWKTDELSKWMIVTKIGVEIKRYPAVLRHLKRFQKALEARQDQGDQWWELRACAYYKAFDAPKIVYPVIAQRPTFALDQTGAVCNDKCYFIESDDRFLLAVLNSTSFWNFVVGTCSPLQGGFYEMRKNSLELVPVPSASASDRSAIASLSQKCLDAKGGDCQVWEREIDERVARLFGMNSNDLVATGRPTPIYDTKGHLIHRVIPKLAAATPRFPYFSLDAIKVELEKHRGDKKPESLNHYLHELTKEGVIFDAGRGWYSTLSQPFVLDREPVRELVELLEKRFPLLEFSCWSTAQIAAYGHHQLARFTSFVYTERDAMESVADALRGSDKTVYVDPGKAEVGKSVRLVDGTIVLRPLVTRAPVDGHFAQIEKILIDLLKEADELKLIDVAEYERMFENVVSVCRISISAMMAYAERRNAQEDMVKWIK